MNRRNLPVVMLLFCVIAFAAGTLELFKLRFEEGDVYPPGSTLRADPLGASAIYESLEKTRGILVNRDFRPTDEMPDGRDTTYIQLGGDPAQWREMQEESFKEIEAFVKSGGRLVIAFLPETTKPYVSRFETNDLADAKNKKTDDQKNAKPKRMAKLKKPNRNGKVAEFETVLLGEKWGVGFEFRHLNKNDDGVYEPIIVENADNPSLPSWIDWHSGLVMTNISSEWQVLYARNSDPVIAERHVGLGTVVFLTDSYLFSNEAMQKDRQAGLLAWLVGPDRTVTFDEAHFGIVEDPGIVMLMRKYRLHGLAAGLLLLAGLFIWKNMAGFGPPIETAATEEFVAGKDSATGFINLLRHHVRPQDLLDLCVTEWKKTLGKERFSGIRIGQVETLMRTEKSLPLKEQNPIRTYQTICRLLKQRTRTDRNQDQSRPSPKS